LLCVHKPFPPFFRSVAVPTAKHAVRQRPAKYYLAWFVVRAPYVCGAYGKHRRKRRPCTDDVTGGDWTFFWNLFSKSLSFDSYSNTSPGRARSPIKRNASDTYACWNRNQTGKITDNNRFDTMSYSFVKLLNLT